MCSSDLNIILTMNEAQFEILHDILDSAVVEGIWGSESHYPTNFIHYGLLRDKVQAIEIKRQERLCRGSGTRPERG